MTEDVADALRGRRLRVTPQRRAILEAFTGARDEHLAADEVLARATVSVPEVSRGTVYATLAELAELGLLAAVGTTDPVRYETNVAAHQHFRCRLCDRLVDVDAGPPDVSALLAEGFAVERAVVVAEGVCADCEAYAAGLRDGAAAVLETPQLDPELVAGTACGAVETPVGALGLAATTDGVVRIAFEDHADFTALQRQTRTRRGGRDARQRVRTAAASLHRYSTAAATTPPTSWTGRRSPARDATSWRPRGRSATAPRAPSSPSSPTSPRATAASPWASTPCRCCCPATESPGGGPDRTTTSAGRRAGTR